MTPAVSPKPMTPNLYSEAVNVYRTSASCRQPECKGSYVADGYSIPLMTPLGPDPSGRRIHRHVCSVCGDAAWYLQPFPFMHYVPAEIRIEEQMQRLLDERQRLQVSA